MGAKKSGKVTLIEAFDIVYQLAFHNALDPKLEVENELIKTAKRQQEALSQIHDFAINHIYEDDPVVYKSELPELLREAQKAAMRMRDATWEEKVMPLSKMYISFKALYDRGFDNLNESEMKIANGHLENMRRQIETLMIWASKERKV